MPVYVELLLAAFGFGTAFGAAGAGLIAGRIVTARVYRRLDAAIFEAH